MVNMTLEAAKASMWEEAKGKLRALVALQGSYSNKGPESDTMKRYLRIKEEVEAFINSIEYNGLHE